jgi:hypothetical protein
MASEKDNEREAQLRDLQRRLESSSLSSTRRGSVTIHSSAGQQEQEETGASQRPMSPTRVTLHRTGSIEIEPGTAIDDTHVAEGAGARRPFTVRPGLRKATVATPVAADRWGDSTSDFAEIRAAMGRIGGTSRTATAHSPLGGGLSVSLAGTLPSSAQSSRAVLSTLRVMQEKIRRLESERDQALNECSNLRESVKAERVKRDYVSRDDALRAAENGGEIALRLAYERLLADKTSAELRIAKAADQRASLEADLRALREEKETVERARLTAERQLAESLRKAQDLEEEQSEEQKRSERASGDVHGRRDYAAKEVERLKGRVAEMEASVAAEKTLRAEAESLVCSLEDAKKQLDQFLSGILKVNERLVVGRKGRKSAVAGSGTKKKVAELASAVRRKTQQKKASGTPQVSTMRRRRRKGVLKGSVAVPPASASNRSPSTVPFLPSGSTRESYNVVATVSKAVKGQIDERASLDLEEIDSVYEELVERLRESVGEVPHLFDPVDGNHSHAVTAGSSKRTSREVKASSAEFVIDAHGCAEGSLEEVPEEDSLS